MPAQRKKTRNQIIYIGNFEPFWSTENDVKKSFEKIGRKVFPVQENKMTDLTVKQIEIIQKDFDFILYTRTWCDAGKIYRQILDIAKIPTVSIHLDLYLGLERGNAIEKDSFFKSNYVFSADGGHQKEFEKRKINHCFLPPATLEDNCFLGNFNKALNYDVIFVGSYKNYHPEWPYRQKLVKFLIENYGNRFRAFDHSDSIWGQKKNDLYNSAKIIVGDSLYSPNYWSDRIPETLGRGGFLIHPRIEGLEKQFEYYKHFVPYFYGDWEGLKEIIDHYLNHPKERDKIRLGGQEWVKKFHTYTNRVKYIIDYLKKNGAI